MQDSDEEEKSNKKNKFSINVNKDDSDDDASKVQKTTNNAGRHKVFQLQIVFNNKKIGKYTEDFNKYLLSFDHHPIQKKMKSQKLQPSEHIYGCLDFFRQEEKLGKDNSWYCSICKDHV